MEVFYFLKDAGNYKSPPAIQLATKEVDISNCYVAPLWMANDITERIRNNGSGLFFLDRSQKEGLFKDYKVRVPANKTNIDKEFVTKAADEINVLIIGGIGPAIGDAMNCLAAIHIFNKKLKTMFKKVHIHLQTSHVEYIQKYVQDSGLIKAVYTIALPALSILSKIDVIYSFESMTIQQGFLTTDILEYFMDELNVSFIESLCDDETPLIRPTVFPVEIPYDGHRKKLLFNFTASNSVRSMDKQIALHKINDLICKTDYQIILFSDDILFNAEFKGNERVSFVRPVSFEEYAYVISKMDKVITVDTSTYHIAETFKIPTAVMFTTIKPELRIHKYHYCKGYTVNKELFEEAKEVWQRHSSVRNTSLIEKVSASFSKCDIMETVKLVESV